MPFPPSFSGPDSVPAEPEPLRLDEDHIIEPLDLVGPAQLPADEPIVVDATGRMWRLRYRPIWAGVLAWAAPLLLGLLLVALLLVAI